MNHITLYTQDRFRYVSELPEPNKSYLTGVLRDTFQAMDKHTWKDHLEAAMASKIADLEETVIIHYVDKSRDLSAVRPIPREQYFSDHTREQFQPFLDALANGDFELAERLTPEGCRLCGYQEFSDTKTIEEYGQGWAGQFCITEVPPGIYPLFANAFALHEAKGLYTNRLKDYPGIQTWLEGTCIRSSNDHLDYPFPNVVCSSPYVFSVAKTVLEGKGDIHLLYPFQAQEAPFQYDGEQRISYHIIDTRLPELLKDNPLRFRMDVPFPDLKPELNGRIRQAERIKDGQDTVDVFLPVAPER